MKQFNILTEDVPENTQLLFLPTPNTDYTDEELSKLDAFLANEESTKSRTLLFTSNPGQARSAQAECIPGRMGHWL